MSNKSFSNTVYLPFKIAWRYVLTQPKSNMTAFISRVSIAGLAIAVALLVTVLSVMNGFEKEMRERILGLLPQITLYGYYQHNDWDTIKATVEKHPNVVASAPYLPLQGLLVKGRKSEASLLIGIDPQQEVKVSVIERYINIQSLKNLKDDQVILGKGLADHLNAKKGDSVVFLLPQNDAGTDIPRLISFKTLDILDSGTEIDRHAMLVNIDKAKEINQIDSQALRITTDNLFNVPQVSYEIIESLPKDFVITDWTKTQGNLYSAINLSKRLLLFLMFIVISVALFNIVSSLVLLVNNKRGDIAILRTLGMSPKEIMLTFLIQGTFISIVGTFIGLIVGLALTYSSNALVSFVEEQFSYQLLNADVYPLNYLPVDVRIMDLLFVCSVAIVIGVVATLYPAWRASKVMPATALANSKA